MLVLRPQAGQVTTRESGEPHITPSDKCPKCDKPIGYLSVNNGFTTPADKGKLQQWCTPCSAVVFYTDAYTTADAEKLLCRIEERNTAIKYKLPPPQQDDFRPEQVVALVSKTSKGCVGEHCPKQRNRNCTYSLCKKCCLARPILDKSCIEHHRNTGGPRPTSDPQSQAVDALSPQSVWQPTQPAPQSTHPVPLPPVHGGHISEAVLSPPNTIRPPTNTQPIHRQPRLQRSAGSLLEERLAAPRSDFASSGADIGRRRAEGLQMSRNQCSIYIWLVDGAPPVPFQVVLPLFPQFTLDELGDILAEFNPKALPIEVYMPTTCEWELIVNPKWPITMITGMKQILLSLRPDYTRQFQDKPRLDELLGRQPRKGPLSKRAAAGDLVSPRKPKVPWTTLPTAKVTPMATLSILHEDDETSDPQPPQSSSPDSPSTKCSSPVSVQRPRTPTSDENQQDRTPRLFPANFLAHDILERTSRYMIERHGKHGRFREIFLRIFGRNCSKSTEANLPKNYPKAYTHFRTLDYDRQMTITWNELIKAQCEDTTSSASVSNDFIGFIPPVRPCTPTQPTLPSSTQDIISPIDGLASLSPLIPSDALSPVVLPLSPAGHPATLPQLPAQFPLNAETLRPLDPEERLELDTNVALIRATRATLGEGIDTRSDNCVSIQEPVGLRCPFCDTELPGRQYSDALLALLNSPKIQTNTVQDPTYDNPNHRRSLIGHGAYSDFCAQHILEELTPVARLHRWPYPPDFSALPQRIKGKNGFLDAVIVGIMTSVDISTFYSNLLVMDDKQRYNKSLDIISAGYYGLTGVRIILTELRLMYPTGAFDFELPDGISWRTFIQYVLIPEVVSMLISEDMNVTLEEAVRIWDESREFGLRAFPDELDEE